MVRHFHWQLQNGGIQKQLDNVVYKQGPFILQTQRDASGLDVLVILPGAEAVPRARPIVGVIQFLATIPISYVRKQDVIPLASVWVCRQPP